MHRDNSVGVCLSSNPFCPFCPPRQVRGQLVDGTPRGEPSKEEEAVSHLEGGLALVVAVRDGDQCALGPGRGGEGEGLRGVSGGTAAPAHDQNLVAHSAARVLVPDDRMFTEIVVSFLFSYKLSTELGWASERNEIHILSVFIQNASK